MLLCVNIFQYYIFLSVLNAIFCQNELNNTNNINLKKLFLNWSKKENSKSLEKIFGGKSQQNSTKICSLPFEHGPCIRAIKVWYFNQEYVNKSLVYLER